VEANSTGGQGSRRAVAPSDDDHNDDQFLRLRSIGDRKCMSVGRVILTRKTLGIRSKTRMSTIKCTRIVPEKKTIPPFEKPATNSVKFPHAFECLAYGLLGHDAV
jgi:hypothetical protein